MNKFTFSPQCHACDFFHSTFVLPSMYFPVSVRFYRDASADAIIMNVNSKKLLSLTVAQLYCVLSVVVNTSDAWISHEFHVHNEG